jgi:hypothetical protein
MDTGRCVPSIAFLPRLWEIVVTDALTGTRMSSSISLSVSVCLFRFLAALYVFIVSVCIGLSLSVSCRADWYSDVSSLSVSLSLFRFLAALSGTLLSSPLSLFVSLSLSVFSPRLLLLVYFRLSLCLSLCLWLVYSLVIFSFLPLLCFLCFIHALFCSLFGCCVSALPLLPSCGHCSASPSLQSSVLVSGPPPPFSLCRWMLSVLRAPLQLID